METLYGLILMLDYVFIKQNNLQILIITCLIIYILYKSKIFNIK
jgi:hypothetical protein